MAGRVDESIIVLLPASVLAGLLPDIDDTAAKIHYMGAGVLGAFAGAFRGKYFHHRGLMHSIVAVLFCFALF